ncbi:acyl-CoA synthetase [Microbacterium sp. Marseille-Q6648]|uniref:acyl-CoA synthetase n=1 Tax=Microbacterium sp. Marseille-Q6648 TaxID=2937991 RepID=UPI00203B568C|nr:acyl-CoA synthetase [Microbacterium sp. Marseille-Q6648]
MTATPSSRTFDVRHVQFGRALFAAIAAVMITFSPDHSAPVGLAVFGGFAVATGLIWMLSLWLVFPAGRRAPALLLGLLTLVAGMVSGIPTLRTGTGFFVVVIAWALLSGLVEALAGWRELRGRTRPADAAPRRGAVAPWVSAAGEAPQAPRAESRDGVTVGILSLVLGIALLFVPAGYALDYTIAEAGQSFTLTGITIAVGVFGGYAAIVAVYLAIAGFTPRADSGDPAAASPTVAVHPDAATATASEGVRASADPKDTP